jgi:hypothetical protein
MGRREIKENDGGVNSTVPYVRTFIYVTIYTSTKII